MGGTALSVPVTRVDSGELLGVYDRLASGLLARFPDARFRRVRHILEKDDHGDLDVLLDQSTVDRDAVRRALPDLVGTTEVVSNGRVDSVDCHLTSGDLPLQLDLVYTRGEWWDFAAMFHDWNDLGNLLGKVARFRRMKLGFQGLRIPVYRTMDRSVKLGEYTLTLDPSEALRFLGYDPGPPTGPGFATFEEMFAYVMSSDLATYDVFQLSVLTASQRHRDTKRGVYKMFMAWLDEHHAPGPGVRPSDAFQRRPSHRRAFDEAAAAFPSARLRERASEDEAALRRRDAASVVFNGSHVVERLGVEGREVGRLLRQLRARAGLLGWPSWEDYVLEMGRERVLEEASRYVRDADHPLADT